MVKYAFTQYIAHVDITGQVTVSQSTEPQKILIASDVGFKPLNIDAEGYIGSGFTKYAIYVSWILKYVFFKMLI